MRLISFPQLRPQKGIEYHRDHVRRKVRKGEFPQPVILSITGTGRNARIAWDEDAIDRWIAEKAAASKGAAPAE